MSRAAACLPNSKSPAYASAALHDALSQQAVPYAADSTEQLPVLTRSDKQPLWTKASVTATMVVMQQAVDSASIPPKLMADVVEEAMFNEQRKEAQLSGFDMAMHGYTPDTNADTKQPIYAWEDEPHKLKNLMQGLQQQQLTKAMDQEVNQLVIKIKQHRAATPDSAKWAPMPPQYHELLLPKVPLLAVARSHPDFSSIATIITGATDHQSVACAEAVFCNPYYIEQVNLAGYPEAALLMLPLGVHTWLQISGASLWRREHSSCMNAMF